MLLIWFHEDTIQQVAEPTVLQQKDKTLVVILLALLPRALQQNWGLCLGSWGTSTRRSVTRPACRSPSRPITLHPRPVLATASLWGYRKWW